MSNPGGKASDSIDYSAASLKMRRTRLRWTIAAVIAGLILLTVVAAAVWFFSSGARCRARLAALQAKGTPTVWTDLVPKAVPDAENAAPLYVRAADLIKGREGPGPAAAPSVGQMGGAAKSPGGPAPPGRYNTKDWSDPARMAVMAQHVEQDADALELVRQATAQPTARFDVDWSNPINLLLTHTAQVRGLMRLVGTAAVVASSKGDQGAALDWVRRGFVMARHVSPVPTIISQLVAYAIDSMAFTAAGDVIGQVPIPEAEARALVVELGRADYMATLNTTMEMERCFGIYMFDHVRAHGDLGTDMRHRIYESLPAAVTYADELVYLRWMDRYAAIAKVPCRDSLDARAEASKDINHLPRYAMLTDIMLPVFHMVPGHRDSAIAMRALVGAALGVEMYRQKMGRYPAALDDVTKEMGWKIEPDPFAGKNLVYKPEGATYLMYSIGEDLKDDGGKPMYYQLSQAAKASSAQGAEVDKEHGDIVWMGTWKGRK